MHVLKLNWAFCSAVLLWSVNALSCDSVLENYPLECSLQDRHRKVREDLQSFHGVDASQIAEYRALRFIGRRSWEKSKARGSVDPAQVYTPAPRTWNIWARGAEFSDSLSPVGPAFIQMDTLREIHRQVIDQELMTRWSVLLKGASPGEIRDSWWKLPPGFSADCKKGQITEQQARVLLKFDLKDSNGRPMVHANLQPCRELKNWVGSPKQGHAVPAYPDSPYYFGFVTYLSSSRVTEELSRLWTDTSADWAALLAGKLRGEISPLTLIADFQRRFIAIHPFGDGNGRTSRLLQDWLLRSLDLPVASSGDLQHDIDQDPETYRQQFTDALVRSTELLESCLVGYNNSKPSPECGELKSLTN